MRLSGSSTTSGAFAGYDQNGRSIRHAWYKTSGNVLVTEYLSTYNDMHRRTSETRTHLFSTVDAYTLDSAQRMLEFDATDNSGMTPVVTSSTGELNGLDKMLSFSDEGTAKNPTVAGGLHQYDDFGGGSRTWDDMGNLVGDETTKGYQYDALGRLIKVWSGTVGSSSVVSTTSYDAMDRRTTKVTSSSGVRYVYAGAWQVIEERATSDNELLRQYVTGQRIDEHIQMRDTTGANDNRYWYHTNSQGFIGALSDIDGDVVEYYEYSMLGRPSVLSPVGAYIDDESTVGNPYSFQGREYEPETGWFHFRFRNYDPSVGEFVTIDPAGLWRHAQGNGYSAFSSAAWDTADPLGLDTYWVGGGLDKEGGPLATNIMKKLKEQFEKVNGGRHVYCGWWEIDEIVEDAVKQREFFDQLAGWIKKHLGFDIELVYPKINLVGHSLGAVTAAEAAHLLRLLGFDVDILITLDPVDLDPENKQREFGGSLVSPADEWVNVYQEPTWNDVWRRLEGFPSPGRAALIFLEEERDDAIATIGGQLGLITPLWLPYFINGGRRTAEVMTTRRHGQAGAMLQDAEKASPGITSRLR